MILRPIHLHAPGELPDLADAVNFMNTVIPIYVRTWGLQIRHVRRHHVRVDGVE